MPRRKGQGGQEPAEVPPLRLEWRSPSELAENPSNWRVHPPQQMGALADAIAEVGWAGACLYNERTGRLIDGHARRRLAAERGDGKVPVLVGNWSEEQERKILATLDPLSAMAAADAAKLDALLREVQTASQPLAAALTDLAERTAVIPAGTGPTSPPREPVPPGEFRVVGEDIRIDHTCPRCGHQWSGGR